VLENHPDCDEVISFDRSKKQRWRYLKQTAARLFELRRRRFDPCLNLYIGGSSNRFSRIIAADIRVCFDHTAELRWANNVWVPCPSFADNWTRALGTMLGPLGIAENQIRRGTSFHCSDAAIEFAAEFVRDRPGPLVAFNLEAGDSGKRWPVENFVALAHEIRDRHGLALLVFTNPGMEALATAFGRLYGESAVVAPLLPLERVGALMLECDFVVSGDTALMHLAFGLKRPTLALFTHTRPEMVAPEDVPCIGCFVENGSGEMYRGKPAGSVDVPVELAVERFADLVKLARAVSASKNSLP
jgi:ADP-heptose:LPS heptosyltransferase